MKKLTDLQGFYIANATLVVAFIIGALFAPYGIDWVDIYQPTTIKFITTEGYNPYLGTGYYNAPWLLWLLAPVAILGAEVSRAAWFAISLTCYVAFALRSKFKPVAMLAFLVSPFVIASLWDGNIDGLVLLGAVLPPFLGIPLLVLKPQIGFVLVLYYAFESLYINRDLNQFVNRFFLLWVFGATSIIVHGFWPKYMFDVEPLGWNLSLWRVDTLSLILSVVVGILLAVSATRYRRDKFRALAAGPFLSPYVAIHSWVAVFPLFRKKPYWSVALTLWAWAGVFYALIRQQSG